MKKYLVACFNEADCINHFKNFYLKIKVDDPEGDARISRENMEISSSKYSIIFRTKEQIQSMGMHHLFHGMIKTRNFAEFTWIESRLEYNELLKATKAMYRVNDRDGFLKFLFVKLSETNFHC